MSKSSAPALQPQYDTPVPNPPPAYRTGKTKRSTGNINIINELYGNGLEFDSDEEEPLVGGVPPPLALDAFPIRFGGVQERLDILKKAISSITTLKKKIIALPSEAMFDPREAETFQDLSSLTTSTASALAHLVEEIRSLHARVSFPRAGGGQASVEESDEAKRMLSEVILAFKECWEHVKNDAWTEKHKREETRLRTARRIRVHTPQLPDEEVVRLLIEAETSGKAPVSSLDINSFKGRWALENPFTELLCALRTQDLSFLNQPAYIDAAHPARAASADQRSGDDDGGCYLGTCR